jgi:tRNA pseudouridine38-40 synthase
MRAHADVARVMTPFRLMEAINARLGRQPVAILACEDVGDDWHARFSCIGRSYVYRIVNRRAALTFERGLVWQVKQTLDADAMHEAAQSLVGLHDFTTFRSSHCQSASPVKTLDRLDVEREGDRIAIHAGALSFLHHQVRSMVGCLALVGMGRWSADDLRAALAARNRAALGLNAPPDGLYFVQADYPA